MHIIHQTVCLSRSIHLTRHAFFSVIQRQKKIVDLLAKREAARDERIVKLDAFLKKTAKSSNGFSFADCKELIRWLRHDQEDRSSDHVSGLKYSYDAGAACVLSASSVFVHVLQV